MTRLLLVAAATLALAACGEQRAAYEWESPTGGPGPVMSVQQALEYRGPLPVAVRGTLLRTNGPWILCGTIGLSDPPVCLAPSLRVANLDTSSVTVRPTNGGNAWALDVGVLGTVDGGVLRVMRAWEE